jgi:hypothetical protein
MEKLERATIISGGAKGADTIFEKKAKKNGFKFSKIGPDAKFSLQEIQQNQRKLKKVNQLYLHRHYPTNSLFINKLLERNVKLALDADILYAIGYIQEQLITGGTAWACYVFIHRFRKKEYIPMYFFDQKADKWYVPKFNRNEIVWDIIETPPLLELEKNIIYTGIGSRDISKSGKEAISSLFNNNKV